MQNGKFDSRLALYTKINPDYRGAYAQEEQWELLVKYHGDLKSKEKEIGFLGEYLYGAIAIIWIAYDKIPIFSNLQEVDYIQLPNQISYNLEENKREICLPQNTVIQDMIGNTNVGLTGAGVLVAVIDSGVDYNHADFRKEDGTTRILGIWDQTVDAKELNRNQNGFQYSNPKGFLLGTFFSEEMINAALLQEKKEQQMNLVPSIDLSGHGTHVTGIIAGNGNVSNGRYQGVAPQASILVVKLGNPKGLTFPRITRMMEAVDFCIQFAQERQMPIAINLSLGNNAGSHTGEDLPSIFFDQVATQWKNSICVGMGNEGNRGKHVTLNLEEGKTQEINFAIPPGQQGFSMEVWMPYENTMEIWLLAPNGERRQLNVNKDDILLWQNGKQIVGVNFIDASPFQPLQEIYIEWIDVGQGLENGTWTFEMTAKKIVNPRLDMWMQTGGLLLEGTRFSQPTANTSLSAQAATKRLISVGAFDEERNQVAGFSGRGYDRNGIRKPDLVAPGVNIIAPAPNNAYTSKSGTSMATPFVTGAAALLMEWGIVRNQDPYLYGEKLKVCLRKGAKKVSADSIPNPREGYGKLCIADALEEVR